MNFPLTFRRLLVSLCVVFGFVDSAQAVVYSTGHHVINTDLGWEGVELRGDAVVEFAPGAKASDILVADQATLNMTGGELRAGIEAIGGKSFITGGKVNTGGYLTVGIAASGPAQVDIWNITVDYIHSTGPYPSSPPHLPSVINFHSGTIKDWVSSGRTGIVNIYGGVLKPIHQGVEVDGVVNIYGGTFGPQAFLQGSSYDGGIVNLYGANFNYPYGTVPVEFGTLTGILADGSPLNIEFVGPDHSTGRPPLTINLLPVPEPSSLVLLALGATALFFRLRSRCGRARHGRPC